MPQDRHPHPLALVIHRELMRIKRHPLYLAFLTTGVVFSYIFFITLMKEGQPERLPIAIVDHDGSYLSRRLCHELNATEGVEVTAVYNTHAEARHAMQRQDIYGFIEIPEGAYADLLAFKAPHMALYANNAYLLPGQLSYKTLATICRLASGAVHREILRKKGMDEEEIMAMVQPIVLDAHTISNPMANYQPYVLTTVLPGIVGLMVAILTIYIVGEEQKRTTAREWLKCARGNMAAALAGKLLPYTFWFSLLGILGNIVFFGSQYYTLQGSFMSLVLLTVVYIASLQAVAVLITALINDMHMAVCVGAIYTTLAFTMSGFSYPVTSMPPALQAFSFIFPLRHHYLTYVDIALYGAPASQWLPHMLPMVALCATFFIAGLIMNRQMVRYETTK